VTDTLRPDAGKAAAQRRRAIVAGSVGNFIEWYEFGIYGFFATIIAGQFFTSGEQTGVEALIATYASFAISFFFRPVGAALFGRLGDRIGRKPTLIVVLLTMSVATALIGFLPTYESIGVAAPILLTLVRIAQGLSAGGEFGGAVSVMTEFAPPGKRGLYGAWQSFTVALGLLAGAGTTALLAALFSEEGLASWGWRIAFWIALPLGLVALLLRLRLEETPEFQKTEQATDTGTRVDDVVVTRPGAWETVKAIGVGIGRLMGWSAAGYTFLVVMPSYLQSSLDASFQQALISTVIANAGFAAAILPAGWLSDRVGRRWVMLTGTVLIVVLALPLLHVLQNPDVGVAGHGVAVFVAGFVVGLIAGPGPAMLSEMFPVRVQPGATVAQVNARLRRYARRLGPDPASEAACTIGGVVANNSSGMACGTEENTYRTLESMVLVLPSGTTIDTARPDADRQLRDREPALHDGLARLRDRVRADPASVATIRRQFALKNTMGYGVNAFLDFDDPVDVLQHLVVGSEGTLAFVAEATFRTVPVLPEVATALAVFPTLDAATRALPDLVASGAATLELMDATSIAVGQRLPGTPAQIQGFAPVDHAALLVEYRADDADALAAAVATGGRLLDGARLHAPAAFSTDPGARGRAWALRKGLYASVAGARPSGTTALLEDVVVPTAALADTCAGLHDLFDRHGYRDAVIFGHAKDGNIHFMLTDRFEGDAALGRYLAFTEGMVDLVLDAGGNLKAEHGTGRAMAPYVRRQYGDELYAVMRGLKDVCDPAGVMNPGVLIDDDPDAHVRAVKLQPTVEDEVDRCVECGYCEPVCPSRDLTLTPRQRIVVRRAEESARARGDHELVAALAEDYDYDGVQTCAVDGMCQTACPVQIDTGALVKRLRREGAGRVASAGWRGAAAAWGPATRAGAAALTAARAVPAPVVRGVTDAARAVLGTDTVPRYDADLPGGGRSRRRLGARVGSATGPVVGVYLPACVSSMFGPASDGDGVTDAFVELLDRAGLAMLVPAGVESLCCGTPWSSKGFAAGHAATTERTTRRVLDTLDGTALPVVSDASSCTEGFAAVLTAHGVTVEDAVTFTARELLPRLDVATPIGSLVLHPTCSSRQLGVDGDLRAVASAVATEVHVPEAWGCCAFAGDRGMLHPELTASATAPEAAEVAAIAADAHASCNRTCEIGMTRATGQPYRHVLELLAAATREARG
jgi:D-lactate dehydrogenase